MINSVILEGRITKEIEVKMTQNGKAYCKFSLAVDRGGKDKGADFINCIAWEKTADFINQYFKKGSPIALEGSIKTGSYDGKNGKVYTTDVLVSKVRFPLTSKGKENEKQEVEYRDPRELRTEDMNVEDVFISTESNKVDDKDLPFF